jgi:hypothetical protein
VIVGVIVVVCVVLELTLVFGALRSGTLIGSLAEIANSCRRSRVVTVLWLVWIGATVLAIHSHVYWKLPWLALISLVVSIVALLACLAGR